MRVPLATDFLILARELMSHPTTLRRDAADRLISEADAAHEYFLARRRCHPRFGDGSLTSRILALAPAPEPVASDINFLDSLRTAALALQSHFTARIPPSQL